MYDITDRVSLISLFISITTSSTIKQIVIRPSGQLRVTINDYNNPIKKCTCHLISFCQESRGDLMGVFI